METHPLCMWDACMPMPVRPPKSWGMGVECKIKKKSASVILCILFYPLNLNEVEFSLVNFH